MTIDFVLNGGFTALMCIGTPVLGVIFSLVYFFHTRRVKIHVPKDEDTDKSLLTVNNSHNENAAEVGAIYKLIYDGAHDFLYAEYIYIAWFIIGFSVILLVVLGAIDSWKNSICTVIAFIVGSLTSVLSGYIGMKIGVYANARTAIRSQASLADGFTTAFKAAIVMGFCLCSLALFNLYILILIIKNVAYKDAYIDGESTNALFEAIAGYGLGGSSIALFGRVGGGIYTKAADVGADLVGKVEAGIPEDSPKNPAVIADNVGDNVGDIAGMGADLFGSFAESSCAALVIAAQTQALIDSDGNKISTIWQNWGYISFPLVVAATGLIACFLTSFFATHFFPPKTLVQIEPTLKQQLLISTIIETFLMLGVSFLWMPSEAYFVGYTTLDSTGQAMVESIKVHNWELFFCLAAGLWSGLIIGYITEYFTSNQYKPVQEVAQSCSTGAATNIIIGLALGYKSVIIPVICMAIATYVGHSLAGFYGVALNAIGILSTLSIGLTIDAFGPISDNAGGIAEMCEMGDEVRTRTDALDAAGNTTAAIGKGFAIGSAAFVSLALFSGYITLLQSRGVTAQTKFQHVDILHAFPFSGLLIGAMIPYWFSAMTMAAVGRAAFAMVQEVRTQFANEPGILRGDKKPDYKRCIQISTTASLKEMIPPGILVMGTPIIVGFLFGCKALAGVLIGALVSGVQIAVSASNTGGAWDNAKKYIEADQLGKGMGKGSMYHKAAVVGDTVGDPLKDTSGPAVNIVMKLMAVESLVLARAFYINEPGFFGWIASKA
mmetsp:Transcript_3412/g.4203  ORF Transcript_3412/g.4203 Transcript_3412/m.4203 type:complete len:776 (+) Transcript_3412:127-2454(+)